MLRLCSYNAHKDALLCIADEMRQSKARRKLLLVPAQAKVGAEQQLIAKLGAKGLLDIEVLGIPRLVSQIYSEVGGGHFSVIEGFSSVMLLSHIVYKKKDELRLYRGLFRSHTFLQSIASTIRQLKNAGITPQMLPKDNAGMLGQKLLDIKEIYQAYEDTMKERSLIDTADKLRIATEKVRHSASLAESEVWVCGFDYFTKLQADFLMEMAQISADIKMFMMGDREEWVFRVSADTKARLSSLAKDRGLSLDVQDMPDTYTKPALPLCKAIEQGLFDSRPIEEIIGKISQFNPSVQSSKNDMKVNVVNAKNHYEEAVSLANEISELVQTKSVRYRDIAVITNAAESKQKTLARVLKDYGIPSFIDIRRGVNDNPLSIFLTSLLAVVAFDFRTNDIWDCLDTGLLLDGEKDDLYDYAIRYKLRGLSSWAKPLKYGEKEYGEAGLRVLDEKREQVYMALLDIKNVFEKGSSGSKIVAALRMILAGAYERAKDAAKDLISQKSQFFIEYGTQLAQMPEIIDKLLDSIDMLVGEIDLEARDVLRLIHAGLMEIDIGLIPPTADQVVIGSMLRSRISGVKHLFILNATADLLPMQHSPDMLFSNLEIYELHAMGLDMNMTNGQIGGEELAIYSNVCQPLDSLYISYSFENDKDNTPAEIAQRLQGVSKSQQAQEVQHEHQKMEKTGNFWHKRPSHRHLLRMLGEHVRAGSIDRDDKDMDEKTLMKGLYLALQGLDDMTEASLQGVSTDESLSLGVGERDALIWARGRELSPSGLETYARCPFSFLVSRGLRLRDVYDIEVGSLDIGNLVHEAVSEYAFLWLNGHLQAKNDSEFLSKMAEIYDKLSKQYDSGALGRPGRNVYKKERVGAFLGRVAIALPQALENLQIQEILTEQAFENGARLPALYIEEEDVQIRGKIDRVDILANGGVGIIDYKTGQDEYNPAWTLSGWQQQLVIYLEAARKGLGKEAKYAYYQKLPDAKLDAKDMGEIDSEWKKGSFCHLYKLDGVSQGDKPVAIDGQKFYFDDIINLAWGKTKRLVSEINKGIYDIRPMRKPPALLKTKEGFSKSSQHITACTYCHYRGLCKHTG